MSGLIRHLAAAGAPRFGIANLAGWADRAAHRADSVDYSVGTLLTTRLLEHVISRDQVSEVDYLIGDDDYKKNWMNQRRERWGIVAFNPKSPRGLLLLIRESLSRLLKRTMHPHST